MLKDIKGVGDKTVETLAALGIESEDDLAFFTPTEYIDLSHPSDLKECSVGDFVLLKLSLTDIKHVKKGRFQLTICYGETEDYKIKIVFYNLPYVSKVLKKGENITAYGKLSYDGCFELVNPQFEKSSSIQNLQGIRPLYKTKGKIPQTTISRIIKNLLPTYDAKSVISVAQETDFALMPLKEAVIKTHDPSSTKEGINARRRLYIELTVRMIKRYKEERLSTPKYKTLLYKDFTPDIDSLIRSLPFTLTDSQFSAIQGIIAKLKSHTPLNALIEGDVGSGKTIVALIIAYFVKLNGYQTAILSPTTILATQHYETATSVFKDFGLKCALLTSSTTLPDRKKIYSGIEDGDIDVVIGTQSVLSQKITWKNLSLLIIDEQHKFGIKDRDRLLEKFPSVDTLSLTATPIPRSLSLIYFGCTDVYYIDGHATRQVKTYIVGKDKELGMFTYISKKALEGAKIFVVAPAIEDMEGILMSGAKDIFSEISKLDGVRADCIHGKLTDLEKENILQDFKQGKTNVLVATTIVEVGIDVPDASVLIVMHADRFGLAVLHQLRGRIGRLGQQAECFLYTEKLGASRERLQLFSHLEKGSEVAELDYDNRGAGEIFGLRQSGSDKTLPPLTIEELKLSATIEEVIVR